MPRPHDGSPPRLAHIGVVLEQVRRQAGLAHQPLAEALGISLATSPASSPEPCSRRAISSCAPRCFDRHRSSTVRAMSSPESDKVGAFGHAVSPLNH